MGKDAMAPTHTGTVVFAGGGTGGHLYPALAIAQRLRERAEGVRCVFHCSDRPLDAQILTRAGEAFEASCAKPLSARPRGLARFLATWGRAVRQARGVIRSEASQGPVVLAAMGGFVAAPAAQAALVERVPLILVNLDAIPGKANRFIAWRARRSRGGEVVSTIPVRDGKGHWEVVGPIVRREALATGDQGACRERLGLDPSRPVLMVTGGSQGARSINTLLTALAKAEPGLFTGADGWQVLHQCGKGEAEAVRKGYDEAKVRPERAVVQEFSDRMGDWWGAAELAIGRCGAGTVAEAWANKVACVFLPYPYHRDEHQKWNAQPLVDAGAAVVVRDEVDAGANLRSAGREIAALMRDAARRGAMRIGVEKLGKSDGADEAARRIVSRLRG